MVLPCHRGGGPTISRFLDTLRLQFRGNADFVIGHGLSAPFPIFPSWGGRTSAGFPDRGKFFGGRGVRFFHSLGWSTTTMDQDFQSSWEIIPEPGLLNRHLDLNPLLHACLW